VGVELGSLSLVSAIEELLGRKVAAPIYKTASTAVGICRADHATASIRNSWHLLRLQAAAARLVPFARGLRPRS
jgi:hypothetical protein